MSEAKVKVILRASHGPDDNRVMQIAWHPIFEHIIAAAGSDHVVHIFDLNEESGRRLEFHKNIVRSIHWCPEIPWLLVSGGDDSLQVIWDIR